MKMKKLFSLLLLALLAGLPGCCCHKKPKCIEESKTAYIAEQHTTDIPRVDEDENLANFFDEDIADFAMSEENDTNSSEAVIGDAEQTLDVDNDELSWKDAAPEVEESVKTVYFDFDRSELREDQKATVAQGIAYVKNELERAECAGITPTVVIEGHACHSAGSAVHNLALSEERARRIADLFNAAGIPAKTVGRGDQCPVVVRGEKISGGRQQQALNRRAQISVIYS